MEGNTLNQISRSSGSRPKTALEDRRTKSLGPYEQSLLTNKGATQDASAAALFLCLCHEDLIEDGASS